MSRKTDLEQHIRESYGFIRDYESIIQTSDRPEERARARRMIEGQWTNIEGYLVEYRHLVRDALPTDIAEIAAHFAFGRAPEAQVVAITEQSADKPSELLTSLRRQLTEAEDNLRLIQERKAQYVLEVDVPLQLIKEERRLLARIAELKAMLAEGGGRR